MGVCGVCTLSQIGVHCQKVNVKIGKNYNDIYLRKYISQ